MSSHLLTEVEQMCTHVGVMRAGRLVAQGPLAELQAAAIPRLRVVSARPAATAQVLEDAGLSNVVSAEDGASGDLGNVPSG